MPVWILIAIDHCMARSTHHLSHAFEAVTGQWITRLSTDLGGATGDADCAQIGEELRDDLSINFKSLKLLWWILLYILVRINNTTILVETGQYQIIQCSYILFHDFFYHTAAIPWIFLISLHIAIIYRPTICPSIDYCSAAWTYIQWNLWIMDTTGPCWSIRNTELSFSSIQYRECAW